MSLSSPGADAADVVVVGAGPVGLAAALELARFGVRTIVLERHPSTSWHPKTRNLNTRTMEIARGWGPGVYERLRAIDTPPGWKSPIRFLRSAVGEQLGQIESLGFEGPGPGVSPAEPIMSSQDLIESILLDAARATGLVDLRFSTEAIELVAGGAPDADHVAVRIATSEGKIVVTGRALVAADGAGSFVRAELGLELDGDKDLLHLVNCYFRADIETLLGDRKGVLFFVTNDDAQGVLQPLDAAGRWLCQISVDVHDHDPETFTAERAQRWIRDAVGVQDLDAEVLSIGFWKLNATVLQRLVHGRVVFCGDAAHQFPPTGGLGVNTGLQGVHNAMWKLALHLRGQAGWSLVETYDTERRPLAKAIAAQSLENSINVARLSAAAAGTSDSGLTPEEIAQESRRYGNHLGVELGAAYTSSAVIPDGTAPPQVGDPYSDYAPSATPGCRIPHAWLGSAGDPLSTLDLVGPRFTLVAASPGHGWQELALEASTALGVAVGCYEIGAPGLGEPVPGALAATLGLRGDGAVLVRPDGHVGWRRASGSVDGAVLIDVLRRLLHR